MNCSEYTKIFGHVEPWPSQTISLRIAKIRVLNGDKTVAVAFPLTFKQLTEEERNVQQPETLRLRPDEAQEFMDELWRCGIRPTEGAGSVGQMAAVQAHLQDMRKLVFDGKT